MAKVFLDPGDAFTVNDNNTTVYGTIDHKETVYISSGVNGVTVDSNVETVWLGMPTDIYMNCPGASFTPYRYLQVDGQLQIYDETGAILLASLAAQNDSDGTQLIIDKDTASIKLADGTMTLGDAVVSASTPQSVVPLTIEPPLFSPGWTYNPAFPPVVGVCSAPPSVAEGGTATFLIQLSQPWNSDITVSYSLSATGGAVLGVDTGPIQIYGSGISSESNTITFPAGRRFAYISAYITSDTFVETGEGLQLDLVEVVSGDAVLSRYPIHLSASVALTDTSAAPLSYACSCMDDTASTNTGTTVSLVGTPSLESVAQP